MKADAFDEEAIKAKIVAAADLIDKLEAKVEADKEGADKIIDNISRFVDTSLDYRKKVKEFMRETKKRKREKTMFDKHHGIVAEYNDLVERSNDLKFVAE